MRLYISNSDVVKNFRLRSHLNMATWQVHSREQDGSHHEAELVH